MGHPVVATRKTVEESGYPLEVTVLCREEKLALHGQRDWGRGVGEVQRQDSTVVVQRTGEGHIWALGAGGAKLKL